MFSVQDLAHKFNVPAFMINAALCQCEFQIYSPLPDDERPFYLTFEGTEYGKEHHLNILWYDSVIPALSHALNMMVQR